MKTFNCPKCGATLILILDIGKHNYYEVVVKDGEIVEKRERSNYPYYHTLYGVEVKCSSCDFHIEIDGLCEDEDEIEDLLVVAEEVVEENLEEVK